MGLPWVGGVRGTASLLRLPSGPQARFEGGVKSSATSVSPSSQPLIVSLIKDASKNCPAVSRWPPAHTLWGSSGKAADTWALAQGDPWALAGQQAERAGQRAAAREDGVPGGARQPLRAGPCPEQESPQLRRLLWYLL